jgi:hypothetical protein
MIIAATFALNAHSIQLQEKQTFAVQERMAFPEHPLFGELVVRASRRKIMGR